jgi:hypothetical protein
MIGIVVGLPSVLMRHEFFFLLFSDGIFCVREKKKVVGVLMAAAEIVWLALTPSRCWWERYSVVFGCWCFYCKWGWGAVFETYHIETNG